VSQSAGRKAPVTNPYITVEDYQGKPVAGKFISREKAGKYLFNVVLEKENGSRFRAVVASLDLDDALRIKGWTDGWEDPNGNG
jgi:hypothetical protein